MKKAITKTSWARGNKGTRKSIDEPQRVWVVRTRLNELEGWFYAGEETRAKAVAAAKKTRNGERVIDAKKIKNVEHVKRGEFRQVPTGDWWGKVFPD